MAKKGIFITFEGLDGSGKTTQIKYLEKYLQEKNVDFITSREPGGTNLGEKLRKVILDVKNENLCDRAEILLYAAARAQHLSELLLPAVNAGKIVICDRYIDSSIAYQGYGRNMLKEVVRINQPMLEILEPDLTFLFQAVPRLLKIRINDRQNDRIETQSMEFHNSVYQGYKELSKKYSYRIITLDALNTKGQLRKQITAHTEKLLKEKGFL